MKISSQLFIVTLAIMLLCSCAAPQRGKHEAHENHMTQESNEPHERNPNSMNARLILLDARISAANSHYKTVLSSIADKRMNAKIAKNESELEQLNRDIAILVEDKNVTEKEIERLVEEYNGAK